GHRYGPGRQWRRAGTTWAYTRKLVGTSQSSTRTVESRSSAATPDREPLRAVLEAVQGLDDVAAQARGLVAGQDLQLIADAQAVAFVEPYLLLDRDLDLAALLTARRRGGNHPHRLCPRGHVHPGAAGKHDQDGSGDGGGNQAHVGVSGKEDAPDC